MLNILILNLLRMFRQGLYWLRTSHRYLALLLNDEFHKPVSLPLAKRLWPWKRGFLGVTYLVFHLDQNDPRDYLADLQHTLELPFINAPYSIILDNKLSFRDVMSCFPTQLPR